jgi:hypothetical protein
MPADSPAGLTEIAKTAGVVPVAGFTTSQPAGLLTVETVKVTADVLVMLTFWGEGTDAPC